MTTLAQSRGEIQKPWKWIAAGAAVLLIWGAVAFPRMATVRQESLPTMRAQPHPAMEGYMTSTSATHSTGLVFEDAAAKEFSDPVVGDGLADHV